MKINSALPSAGSATDMHKARAPASVASGQGSSASERVDISSLSARLQEVGSADGPANSQRIAEIKQAISEGRFQINPEKIADGLLSSVRDILGRDVKAN